MCRSAVAGVVLLAAIVVAPACQPAGGTTEQQPPPAAKPSPGSGPVKGTLAKARLQDAAAEAKGWKADAILIQVAGRNVGEDGASFWDYGFYSPTAKTCLVVKVAPTAHKQESGGQTCASPELTDFMDSDRAMKIARASGITQPKATAVVRGAARGDNAVWAIFDNAGVKSGDVMLDIDARTGAVLNKTAQK